MRRAPLETKSATPGGGRDPVRSAGREGGAPRTRGVRRGRPPRPAARSATATAGGNAHPHWSAAVLPRSARAGAGCGRCRTVRGAPVGSSCRRVRPAGVAPPPKPNRPEARHRDRRSPRRPWCGRAAGRRRRAASARRSGARACGSYGSMSSTKRAPASPTRVARGNSPLSTQSVNGSVTTGERSSIHPLAGSPTRHPRASSSGGDAVDRGAHEADVGVGPSGAASAEGARRARCIAATRCSPFEGGCRTRRSRAGRPDADGPRAAEQSGQRRAGRGAERAVGRREVPPEPIEVGGDVWFAVDRGRRRGAAGTRLGDRERHERRAGSGHVPEPATSAPSTASKMLSTTVTASASAPRSTSV